MDGLDLNQQLEHIQLYMYVYKVYFLRGSSTVWLLSDTNEYEGIHLHSTKPEL